MPGLLRILLVILLLAVAATGTAGAVSLPSGSASDVTTALAKEGHGGNKGKGDEKKHDNGKTEDEKDKDKKDKDKDNKGRGKAVEPVADYAVEVSCAYDAATDRTTCTFQGITPDGGMQIGHLDLAEADVCAEVVGGDYEAIDPDPNTGVTGFKSRGSEGRITLILQGEVAVEGTITYWVKAANNVFPVPGPGLVCVAPEADEAGATAPVTEETAPSGGALVVTTATCPEKPADPAAYDWYGLCQPEETGDAYALADVTTGTDAGVTPETIGEGERTYTSLESGTYTFTPVSEGWCHAESDNVNAEGQLIISEGETTHLWIFNCPRAAGS